MSIISDSVFADKPGAPPRLYHYTSQKGLLGILDSKTLWATRIQYLNDSTEFAYTLTLLKKEFDLQEKRFSLDPISNAFDNLRLIPIYVACFSEKEDDLSQWRGYCAGGGGFSIGFDTNQLVKAAKRRTPSFMAPCVYDFYRQSQLVEQLVDRFIKQSMTEGVDAKKKVLDFTADCVFLACFLKHPSFKDEQEWRIVLQAIAPTDPQLAFRTSRAVLVPYLRFELTEPEAPLDIHLVVGPNAEMELALESATRLLAAKKCTGPPVSASIVPYRLL